MAFDLNSVKRGPDLKPPRLFLYAVEGIGKTTFGASAPIEALMPHFGFTVENVVAAAKAL